MTIVYAVCSERASDCNSYSMCIIEEFDSYEEAEVFLLNDRNLFADFYYIKKLYKNG